MIRYSSTHSRTEPARGIRIVVILLMAVLWCSSGGRLAHADKRKDDDIAEAKRHFKRAQVYQRKQRYDEAAREYLLSYKLFQNAELLFNAAEMFRVGRKLDQALKYYRKYLALEPDGRASPNARKYVAEIRGSLGTPAANEDDPVRKPEPVRRDARSGDDDPRGDDEPRGDDQPGGDDEPRGDDEPSGNSESPGDDEPSGGGGSLDDSSGRRGRSGRSGGNGSLRVLGIGSMLGGGVSLVLAARAGSEAQTISNELSAHEGAWTDAQLARQDDGQQAEKNMFIFAGVGVALGVAGTVLYFMSKQSSTESDDLGFAPLLTPNDVGIALSGRF